MSANDSVISQAKDDLAAALASTGAAVLTYVPEALPAPCVVIEGEVDYLSTDETTYDPGEFWLTLSAFVLVDLVGNQQATEDLDKLIGRTAGGLARAGYSLVSMTKPGPFHTTEWLAHGVGLTVRTLINLNTQETS